MSLPLRLLLLALAVGLTTACPKRFADRPDGERKSKQRPPPEANSAGCLAATGASSLWSDQCSGASLFKDARAFKTGDLVVVKVEENADARRSTDVDVERAAENAANVSAFLNVVGSQLSADAKTGVKNTFRGSGSTARSEKLTATVPAIIRRELGNGQVFIEGDRQVLVNNEEHHFYISGIIRTYDIDQENSVKSSMVAEAEIEFTGRGLLTDNQQQGFFQRFFGWIWPF